MPTRLEAPLAELTTLRLGGPARRLVTPESDADLIAAVSAADRDSRPVLLLAGGSNLVISDLGFDGVAVRIATHGVKVTRSGERVRLTVAAGEPWDELVARCVADGLAGIECLSGIPGSVGATPIQNVGAYGQEIAATVRSVSAWDRTAGKAVAFDRRACGFGYRTSMFKGGDRYVVLAVTLELEPAAVARPIAYPQLAAALGVRPGDRPPLAAVREAVLGLRRTKGMVVDPADPDSVSAGSFFTNPILDQEGFRELVRRASDRLDGDEQPPGWSQPDGAVKTSAAWLIERAGFERGYGNGAVGISTKHTLALVNRGGGTTAELLALARELRDGVRATFGVTLAVEPTLVGVTL
jgi:UDP-N-acetylmuramate dehydrogenase